MPFRKAYFYRVSLLIDGFYKVHAIIRGFYKLPEQKDYWEGYISNKQFGGKSVRILGWEEYEFH